MKPVLRILTALCLTVIVAFSASACNKSGGGDNSASTSAPPALENRDRFSFENVSEQIEELTLGDLETDGKGKNKLDEILEGYLLGDVYAAILRRADERVTGTDFSGALGFGRYTDGKWRSNFESHAEAHRVVTGFFNYRLDGSATLEVSRADVEEFADTKLVELMYSQTIIENFISPFAESDPMLNALIMKTTVGELESLLAGEGAERQAAADAIFDGASVADCLSLLGYPSQGFEEIPLADAIAKINEIGEKGADVSAYEYISSEIQAISAEFGELPFNEYFTVGELMSRLDEYISATGDERAAKYAEFDAYAQKVTLGEIASSMLAFVTAFPEETKTFISEYLGATDPDAAHAEIVSALTEAATSEVNLSEFIKTSDMGEFLAAFGLGGEVDLPESIKNCFDVAMSLGAEELLSGNLAAANREKIEKAIRGVKIADIVAMG